MDPTSNLRLGCIQSRQAPFEHLPESCHDRMESLFELSIPLNRDTVMGSRSQSNTPGFGRRRGWLLRDSQNIQWPRIMRNRNLGKTAGVLTLLTNIDSE